MRFVHNAADPNRFYLMDDGDVVLATIYRPRPHYPKWIVDIDHTANYYDPETPEETILKTVVRDVWAIHQSRANRLGRMFEQEGYAIEPPC